MKAEHSKGSSIILTSALLALGWLGAGCQSTPLHQTIQVGNRAAALKMIQAGKGIDIPDPQGRTPLVFAVRKGDLELARELVAKGADVNGRANSADFPLAAAARTRNEQMTDFLLENHANANQVTAGGLSALHDAAFLGDLKLSHKLLDAGARVDTTARAGARPLFSAAAGGKAQPELLALLLDHGADVNFQLAGHDTPLIAAAVQGNCPALGLLITRKADLERKGVAGRTALIAAAAVGHPEACDLLIRSGAKLEATAANGGTALGEAIHFYRLDTARVLVDAGAAYTVKTNTPEERFCAALYRKVLADKQLADNQTAIARDNYSISLASLTALRAEFSKTAESDSKSAARRIFWNGVLAVAAEVAIAGAAGAGGAQIHMNHSAVPHIGAPRTFHPVVSHSPLIRPSVPGGRAFEVYPLPPVRINAALPPSGIARLQAEAEQLRAKAGFCDEVIKSIQAQLAGPALAQQGSR